MAKWRELVAIYFGPGLLSGMTLGTFCEVMRKNRFRVSPRYWYRAAVAFQYSVLNSLLSRRENRRFGQEIQQQQIQPPIFVLGHWRSGTTHLHNLLCIDDRFGFPNVFSTLFPHTFLTSENGIQYKLLNRLIPEKRPMDNMHFGLSVPWEDEYALCLMTGLSPYMSGVFPRQRELHDQYFTFRDVKPTEVDAWKSAFCHFLKKLTYKHHRPLVLKSPPHTSRIPLLLQMFPNAKFVHIHRHPFDVYRSIIHQTAIMLHWYQLQSVSEKEMTSWIIDRYKQMYDVYFEDVSLIPEGQFVDVRFDDLESNPLSELERVYQMLKLPDFEYVRPTLHDYASNIAGYQRNKFTSLATETQDRLTRAWQRCFEQWDYTANTETH